MTMMREMYERCRGRAGTKNAAAYLEWDGGMQVRRKASDRMQTDAAAEHRESIRV